MENINLIVPDFKPRKVSYLDNTDGLGLMTATGVRSHEADAIKDLEDIERLSAWLVAGRKYKYNLMLIAGCNMGLRFSDLSRLRFGNIMDADGEFYDEIQIVERKTAKGKLKTDGTRGRRKPPRTVYINDAVKDAFYLYAGSLHWKFDQDQFLFCGNDTSKPMGYTTAYNFFMKNFDGQKGKHRDILAHPIHTSMHCFRKTYAYHFIMGDAEFQRDPMQAILKRNRKIELLQKCFGHSDQATTLRYAGITDDEIGEIVSGMNLGAHRFLNVGAASITDAYPEGVLEGNVLEVQDD